VENLIINPNKAMTDNEILDKLLTPDTNNAGNYFLTNGDSL
jgi:hypothetical protein